MPPSKLAEEKAKKFFFFSFYSPTFLFRQLFTVRKNWINIKPPFPPPSRSPLLSSGSEGRNKRGKGLDFFFFLLFLPVPDMISVITTVANSRAFMSR